MRGLVRLPNCLPGKVWVARAGPALPAGARAGTGEIPTDGLTRQEPRMGRAVLRMLGLEGGRFWRRWHYLFSDLFPGHLPLLSAKQGSRWQGHAGDRRRGWLVPAQAMSLCRFSLRNARNQSPCVHPCTSCQAKEPFFCLSCLWHPINPDLFFAQSSINSTDGATLLEYAWLLVKA